MIRKLFTTILCVLLALALPLSAMAATEYTFTMVPGDDLASVEAFKDLAEALSLRLLGDEQSAQVAIALSGSDVLSLALRGTVDGIYVQSAELAEKPLYFSRTDVATFVSNMADADDAPTAAAIKQSVDQMFTAFGVASTSIGSESFVEQTEEEIGAEIGKVFQNDPAMADYVLGIIGSMEITDGEYTDAAHDPATQMMTLTIDNDDLLKLADTETVKNAMASDGSGATSEQAIEKYKKFLENVQCDIPMTFYTADEGKTLVAMSIPMTMKGTVEVTEVEDGVSKTENKNVDIAMDMQYNRLTNGAQIDHSAIVNVANEGETKLDAQVTVAHDGADGYTMDATAKLGDDADEVFVAQGAMTMAEAATTGWLAMLADETQFTIGFTMDETAEGKQKSVSIYTRADAAAIIAPTAADRPIMTLNLQSKEVSNDALAAVNAATPETSMQLLQLSATEQQAAISEITSNLIQAGLTAMGSLPQSVIQLFTGMSTTTTQAQ